MGYEDAAAFAEFIGVPSAVIERFEDGGIDGNSGTDTEAFIAIGTRCRCSFDWLYEGRGHSGSNHYRPPVDSNAKVAIFPAHRCPRG